MTAILGLSAFYHDSAAALIVDGQIVAAAQEERFTRVKHDSAFPTHAIEACLNIAGISHDQIDLVCFYEKPLLKLDRLLETQLAFAPSGFRSFRVAMVNWIERRLFYRRDLKAALRGAGRHRIVYPEHHESHGASAFYPSPFESAAILTLDGVGEWATTTWGEGQGNRIRLFEEMRFPHSLGLLYSAFTAFCGFQVDSGEYKLMGLAPFGEPKYAETIRRQFLDLRDDGSFCLNMEYFNFCQGLTMTSNKFARLFDGPPRVAEGTITQREMDLAASVQQVLEDIVLRIARYVHRRTGQKHLCLAGGVALNCVANGRLLREGPFEKIWIQPAAGDAGGALGCALFAWHQLLERPRSPRAEDSQNGSQLGPAIREDEVRRYLDRVRAKATFVSSEQALCRQVAELLAAGRVVGWVQGRMEFGPRALGCRSILGDARRADMQRTMNLKIKFRESFRPFAPAVLSEKANDHFEADRMPDSPYMLLVTQVRNRTGGAVPQSETSLAGLDRIQAIRSHLPAITHVDGSARVQTVDAARHPRFHGLLQAFEAITGSPVLINTSFNVRGEPIVQGVEDAYRCFLATNIDVLVIENFILLREEQPQLTPDQVRQYLAGFPPD